MTEELFPEVSNWKRKDPEQDNVHDVWRNYTTWWELRTRKVTGPFPTDTSQYILERRDMTDDENEWEVLGKADSYRPIEREAYEIAQELNENNE
jgi:hypothetical protein